MSNTTHQQTPMHHPFQFNIEIEFNPDACPTNLGQSIQVRHQDAGGGLRVSTLDQLYASTEAGCVTDAIWHSTMKLVLDGLYRLNLEPNALTRYLEGQVHFRRLLPL
jgi:hypothetical protein